MTQKVYKTAMGRAIDLGQLMLENEHVRAVGNMNVNARGDLLDGANRVIDTKPRQLQRQYNKQSVAGSKLPVTSSSRSAKQATTKSSVEDVAFSSAPLNFEEPAPVPVDDPVAIVALEPVEDPTPPNSTPIPRGGLAAAIAKSKVVAQQKEKTPRQLAQSMAGVKKI
jgi:hypothetical protein